MSEKKYKFDPEHTFFTSDTHFGHANIIRFCNRPFRNVEEMNEALIENWNLVVSEDDTVFHLGDFAFGGSNVWKSIIPRLNGHINLIIGNHDRKNLRQGYMSYFDMVVPQLQIEIEDNSIYLNHYPFLCYGGSYRGVWQLFGHVHSGPQADGLDISRLRVLLPTQYDVGVDNNNFTPISYREVKEKIESQKNESLDRTVSR
jgi:calcineurin-like phosphoesterase family protein